MPKKKSTALQQMLKEKRNIFQIYLPEIEKLDFEQIFGNDNPVYLEIGSGRGEFIISQSLLEWDKNFIGIECNSDRLNFILRHLDEKRHQNVRLLNTFIDVNTIKHFPADSLSKIFIIHPDPWPKRRHHRRRLINHQFLDMLFKILKPRGFLEIQTDHAEYAEWICRHLKEREDFVPFMGGVSNIPRHKHIVTYFEEKKLREGNKISYISYRTVE